MAQPAEAYHPDELPAETDESHALVKKIAHDFTTALGEASVDPTAISRSEVMAFAHEYVRGFVDDTVRDYQQTRQTQVSTQYLPERPVLKHIGEFYKIFPVTSHDKKVRERAVQNRDAAVVASGEHPKYPQIHVARDLAGYLHLAGETDYAEAVLDLLAVYGGVLTSFGRAAHSGRVAMSRIQRPIKDLGTVGWDD